MFLTRFLLNFLKGPKNKTTEIRYGSLLHKREFKCRDIGIHLDYI